MTMPETLAASRVAISTTSAAAPASCSGVTIMPGARFAVAPMTARSPGLFARAISTISVVVSREEFGLISSACFKPSPRLCRGSSSFLNVRGEAEQPLGQQHTDQRDDDDHAGHCSDANVEARLENLPQL